MRNIRSQKISQNIQNKIMDKERVHILLNLAFMKILMKKIRIRVDQILKIKKPRREWKRTRKQK